LELLCANTKLSVGRAAERNKVFLLQTTIRQSKTFSLKRLREEPLGAILLHAWHIDSAFVRANLEIRILPCFPPLDPAM
jgi:hypothetical protein